MLVVVRFQSVCIHLLLLVGLRLQFNLIKLNFTTLRIPYDDELAAGSRFNGAYRAFHGFSSGLYLFRVFLVLRFFPLEQSTLVYVDNEEVVLQHALNLIQDLH